jgi:hypothetical protein
MNQMTTQSIVRKALQKEGKADSFKRIYTGLYRMLETPKYRLMRSGNTLFLIEIVQVGMGKVQLINGDDPKKTMENIFDFIQAIKKANYKQVIFDSSDALVTDFFNNSNIPSNSNNGNYIVDLASL